MSERAFSDRQLAALEMCEEICERADYMGLGLVKFMVSDVRELTAIVRRRMMVASIAKDADHD